MCSKLDDAMWHTDLHVPCGAETPMAQQVGVDRWAVSNLFS